MGLSNDNNGRSGNFVEVKHGGLCMSSKEPMEGYEEISVFNPSTGKEQPKWIKRFSALNGMVKDIEWYDTEAEFSTRFMGIKIKIEDAGEYFTLDLTYGTKAFDTFTKMMESIDYTKEVVFISWKDKKTDSTAFSAKQDGQIVRQMYTKDNPGDAPVPTKNKLGKWNFDEQKEFLLDKLMDVVIPKVKALNDGPVQEYPAEETPTVEHEAPKRRGKAASATVDDSWENVPSAFHGDGK